jgi:type IV pilus assembly protein PilQ
LWGFVLITLIVTTAAGAAAASDKPAQIIDKFDVEEDFDIRKALAMLGSLCDKNIVPSPNVNGALAFRSLKNITFEEAMDAILGENFKYEQDGKLIKVYTKDEYKKMKEDPERKIYKVFTLYYISAAEAIQLITPVLSTSHTIQGSSPAETIVPTGDSISGGSVGGDTMALNDTIVIVDYPENIAEAEKLLKELDVRPQQVLVEATILSAALTEETAMGIDWNTLDGVMINTIFDVAAGATGAETFGFAGAVQTSVSEGGLAIGVSSDHVKGLIRALETATDTTILANPKILAINKQLGQVYIGNKIGYVSQTTQTQTSTTQQVEFLDTGTKLSFRPYIGNDGYIRMDIHPKDSDGTLKINAIPDEKSTELATNIMVKDGHTIVIGGLFRDVVTTTRSQVPIVGDLPLVGALFRSTNDSNRREEVIVMLTCRIVKEAEDTEGIERAEDIKRKRFGAKDELQWISRARLAEDAYARAAKCYLEGDAESAMKELKNALTLRPNYLEAIRLKERIIAESSPADAKKLERIMLEEIDQHEASNWQRR